MHDLARVFGFVYVAAGVFLAVFPHAARQTMRARAEFTELSDGALRILGIWMFLTGWALVWVTAGARVRSMIGETLGSERRVAA